MAKDLFNALEAENGLPRGLLDAVWSAESSRGKNMRSPVGAQGHFQFMPATAKQYGLQNPDDLNQSAAAAARMYGDLMKKYNDLPKALAAYNWGQGNVDRKGMNNAPAETRGYIQKITGQLQPEAKTMAGRDLSSELFGDPQDPAQTAGGRDLSAELFGEASPKLTRADKVVKGLRDPIDGGAQLLTNILPASVVKAGNAANNWLADKTGLVGRLPEGGVSQQVSEGEQAYQAQRQQSGETGIDGYRLLGNLASPANLAIASKLPVAAGFAGRVGVGAGGGAASAALAPVVGGDDYGAEKTKQIATGALFGGAVPAVTGGLARVISPNASRNTQLALLKSEGVKPTIGQSLGGAANRLEEKLQSVPFLGDSITAARQRSGDDLARAAANRALFPLGKSVPQGVKGNDAVLYVRKAMNDAYDDIAPKLGVTQDPAFKQTVGSLQTMVKQGAINPNAKEAFNRFMKNDVNPLFQGQNQSMSGETFKRLQSKITEKIQQTTASTDADQRLLNGAYKELGDQLNQLSMRTNPQAASKLKAINTGYANFKRLQKASASVAAEDGNFTPAMLHNAVKAADRSKDKARFAEGGALMQDLSAAGKTLLSNKVPNSGTADRLMAVGGIGGLGMLSPAAALAAGGGLLGGSAMYTPFMQQLMSGAVSARPQLAQPASEMLRKAAPALVPGGAQFGLGLLNY